MKSFTSFYHELNQNEIVIEMLKQKFNNPKLSSLGSDFLKLLKTGEYSDYQIKVENTVFKVHKFVLASRVKFFRKLFKNSKTINFDKFKSKSFKILLDYIYSGKFLIKSIDKEDIFDLMNLMNFLKIKMKNFPEYLIHNLITHESIISFYKLSYNLKSKLILESCVKYMIKNFKFILTNNDYLNLDITLRKYFNQQLISKI